MRLSDILHVKGSDVFTGDPGWTALEATRALIDHNIGAMVVVEDGTPVGIVSERDMLRLASRDPHAFERTLVADIMTRELVLAAETDSLPEAMEVMTTHRVRHLPVTREGSMVGIVSIGESGERPAQGVRGREPAPEGVRSPGVAESSPDATRPAVDARAGSDPAMLYSARMVSSGSTRAARAAGIQHATRATAPSSSVDDT